MHLLVVGSTISTPYFRINPFSFVDIPLQFSWVERLSLLTYLGSDDYDLSLN